MANVLGINGWWISLIPHSPFCIDIIGIYLWVVLLWKTWTPFCTDNVCTQAKPYLENLIITPSFLAIYHYHYFYIVTHLLPSAYPCGPV
uniref:Uncharacterized protein n=1 Tax=Pyxicephalus adspersus TaxID=30357 RepID=A0AAV2ZJ73_PYXAD|nr:TPA: hypothetical protein GDO54_005032 [Pyxicephalus adspersus]